MTDRYFDTSALVKRYVAEAGTHAVRRLARPSTRVYSSRLLWSETLAAFARRQREGDLRLRDWNAIRARFATDFRAYNIVELSSEVDGLVADLVRKYPLHGADAVHLASADLLRNRGLSIEFVAADTRLLDVAEECGYAIVDVSRD